MEYLLLGGLAYAGQQYAKISTGKKMNQDPRATSSTSHSFEDVQADFNDKMDNHLKEQRDETPAPRRTFCLSGQLVA